MFGRKFDFNGPFTIEENTSCYSQLDSLLKMQFRYQLQYRPKVSANLGFSFGIGPKPKQWFRSYTTLSKSCDHLPIANQMDTTLVSDRAICQHFHCLVRNGTKIQHLDFGMSPRKDVQITKPKYVIDNVLWLGKCRTKKQ